MAGGVTSMSDKNFIIQNLKNLTAEQLEQVKQAIEKLQQDK